ncbi:unnamed protein product [Periconia digitata]|uniref:Uncharacterized protein n=1 Tax=Periconia digitata TaxID=1303443 RepID=A0A9W4XS44_9PLEO|nr:unnamed protein product [Periconia digitata]
MLNYVQDDIGDFDLVTDRVCEIKHNIRQFLATSLRIGLDAGNALFFFYNVQNNNDLQKTITQGDQISRVIEISFH